MRPLSFRAVCFGKMHFLQWMLRVLGLVLGLQLQLAAGSPGAKPVTGHGLEPEVLSPRQFPDLPPDVMVDDNCRAMCDAPTCFLGVCPLRRRGELDFDAGGHSRPRPGLLPDYNVNFGNDTDFDLDLDLANITVGPRLGKRVFGIPVTNVEETISYMKRQFRIPPHPMQPVDPDFGGNIPGFFSGGPLGPITTVSYERRLLAGNNQRFQWGTNGLHGCTMMLLVSTRAAWMAHFWEVGALCGHDDFLTHRSEDPEDLTSIRCQENWNNEVRDVMFGSARPSVPSVPISFNLYNGPRAQDQTRLIFMAPAADGATRRPRPRYPRKMRELTKLIKQEIPELLEAHAYYYPPLNYNPESTAPIVPGSDAWKAENTERGHALFQWDGATNWRVLYESYHARN
ncbi:hypothetical protein B0T16DRAFT_446675 [Cercophora newfieldiana]|uniref:Uncharacterized protein n=1 Tax=Cercophora newfieldiana TaxID=92897 RepID=A0AA39Y643_9PEZI|nr:hypothetical protein B0T16DRAFT_446675 [Cercophora newfieldiana]